MKKDCSGKSNRLLALIKIAFLMLICAILGGCGFMKSRQDAEKVVARHFQSLSTNGYADAMADYSTLFFQKTSKDEWTKSLSGINSRLGAYQNYKITGWNVFKNAGATGSGATVRIQCQVTYAKYPALETFTLFKGSGDSAFKIVGHQINSDGLLKE